MHAHNDSECAVANSVIAVESGASQVQGTINGLGERCGNANLCSVIPDLQVKLGMKCISADQLRRLRDVARFVNEIANIRHFKRQPFVGDSAFAHKAGIHVSAIRKADGMTVQLNSSEIHRGADLRLLGKSNILRRLRNSASASMRTRRRYRILSPR
jgi:2-isopropylmalate synthase